MKTQILKITLTVALVASMFAVPSPAFAEDYTQTTPPNSTESIVTNEPSDSAEADDQGAVKDNPSHEDESKNSDAIEDNSSAEDTAESNVATDENATDKNANAAETDTSEATSETEEDTASEDEEFETESEETAIQIKMYRLYNQWTGEHFYTGNYGEFDTLYNLGWNDEGVGWIAPSISDYPVYRLYNPYSSDHHYTMSEDEYNACIAQGWSGEGVGWYSSNPEKKSQFALYREFNPYESVGTHNYTLSKSEHQSLVSIGWRDEGIAWCAMNDTTEPGTRPDHPKPKRWPVYYSQRDPRWAYKRFGYYTMDSSACVPTSIAMAIAGIKGDGTTPVDVASYLYDIHEYNYGGIGAGANASRLALEHWGLRATGIDSYATLKSCLQNGDIVIFNFDPPIFTTWGTTHAMALFDLWDDDTCYIYDPYGGIRTGRYSLSSIWANRSTNPDDWDGRFIGYSANK